MQMQVSQRSRENSLHNIYQMFVVCACVQAVTHAHIQMKIHPTVMLQWVYNYLC